ncbi:MAG: universal stress protein [Gammaproteobacteria bacterium]|nr:universal stress protein [Gammaproteobacteria bacterium]
MFKQILLPINLEESDIAGRAIAVAEDFAEKYGAGLTALTAIPDFNSSMVASFFPDDAIKKAHAEVCVDMKKFIDSHFRNPAKVHCSVGEGSTRKVIIDYVKKHHIDLVVIPARKRDIGRILLGSNSAYVVDHAPCSVMVIRP